MKTYWNNLNDRERLMLAVGGVIGCLFLLYLLILAPLMNAVRDKSQQLAEKQQTLAWMQQVHHQHTSIKARQVLSNSELLTVLAKQLGSTSFHRMPYQLQQTGVGDIELSFDNVPYNAFISWLWSIRKTYQFNIKQLNAERTKVPGVVKLALIIH